MASVAFVIDLQRSLITLTLQCGMCLHFTDSQHFIDSHSVAEGHPSPTLSYNNGLASRHSMLIHEWVLQGWFLFIGLCVRAFGNRFVLWRCFFAGVTALLFFSLVSLIRLITRSLGRGIW